MSSPNEGKNLHLAIEIDPGLRTRIEAAAAERGISIEDHVVVAPRQALDSNDAGRQADASGEWSRLSHPSFARDWESDADPVYNNLEAISLT